MQGAKPWQIGLVVLGLIVLAGSVVYQCTIGSDAVNPSSRIQLIDVETGELIDAAMPSNGTAVMFPATNPATSKATLFPAYQKDGKWFTEGRYIPQMKGIVKGPIKWIADPQSGELAPANAEPKSVQVFP